MTNNITQKDLDAMAESVAETVTESMTDVVENAVNNEDDLEPVYEKVDKITPSGDISWKVKWISTVLAITGSLLLNAGLIFPGAVFGVLGVTGWVWVGILWNDHAIITMNAVYIGLFLMSITNQIVEIFKTGN